jgi:lactam utilization protein B
MALMINLGRSKLSLKMMGQVNSTSYEVGAMAGLTKQLNMTFRGESNE